MKRAMIFFSLRCHRAAAASKGDSLTVAILRGSAEPFIGPAKPDPLDGSHLRMTAANATATAAADAAVRAMRRHCGPRSSSRPDPRRFRPPS
jgi:hypothetical protein